MHPVLLVGHAGEEGALGHLGAPIQPRAAPLQAGQAHQARHPAATHGEAVPAQLTGHARAAVVAAAALVHRAHLLDELLILHGPLTELAVLPGVEAAACQAEQRAHHLDRVSLPVNSPSRTCRRHLDSITALSLKAMPYRLIFCGPGVPTDHFHR